MNNYFDSARAVLAEAYEHDGQMSQDTINEVLAERYPCGSGGVGHAQRRMKRETAKRIREWLEPADHSREPNP